MFKEISPSNSVQYKSVENSIWEYGSKPESQLKDWRVKPAFEFKEESQEIVFENVQNY